MADSSSIFKRVKDILGVGGSLAGIASFLGIAVGPSTLAGWLGVENTPLFALVCASFVLLGAASGWHLRGRSVNNALRLEEMRIRVEADIEDRRQREKIRLEIEEERRVKEELLAQEREEQVEQIRMMEYRLKEILFKLLEDESMIMDTPPQHFGYWDIEPFVQCETVDYSRYEWSLKLSWRKFFEQNADLFDCVRDKQIPF